MKNPRPKHDVAVAIAQASLDVVASCVRPELHKDVWEEFYRIALAGVESFDVMRDRTRHRLRPTNN